MSKKGVVLYCALQDVPEAFSCLRRVKMSVLLKEKQRPAFGVCCCVCSVSRAHLMLIYKVRKTGNGWQFSPKR